MSVQPRRNLFLTPFTIHLVNIVSPSVTPQPHLEEAVPQFTRRQRLLLWLIEYIGYLGIHLIGMTVRFSLHMEEGGPSEFRSKPFILCFWHEAIFSATYAFRDQQIGVLTSQSFDGEYIGRIISRFGYRPIRGSSSRGGVRALLAGRRHLNTGSSVAFTTDGPRGPTYTAKPGPVLLARKSGVSMVAFHVAVENAWHLSSWDRSVIPKPFTRALISMSQQITVSTDTGSESERFQAELQAAQARVRDFAESNVKHVGSPEFPICRI